jgi:hypothetical protein
VSSKKRKGTGEAGSGFSELLWTIDSNVRYMQRVGAKPDLLRMWENLLTFLRRLPEKDVRQIEGIGFSTVRGKVPTAPATGPTDAELAAMSIEAIAELLLKEPSRRDLERLARIRFNLTAGDLSNLSNRSALVEKIRSMSDNEAAHRAIERVAGKGGTHRLP